MLASFSMVKLVARVIGSYVITLWGMLTGTFLLMEAAPGGPGSTDRPVDPLLECASLARVGLLELVRAPCEGKLSWLPAVGEEVSEKAALIEAGGPGVAKASGRGEVVQVFVREGQHVRRGSILIALRPPLANRYIKAILSMLSFDLGVSLGSRGERTVKEILAQSFPVSATLGLLSLAFALLLGIPLGLVAGAKEGGWTDRLLSVVSTAQVSIPAIVLGPLLLYFFAVKFPLFSPGGLVDFRDFILPAFTLGIIVSGTVQRMTRAATASFCASSTFFYLRARGIPPSRLYGVHALRHASIPMLGYLPPMVAGLLSGSLVVERIFNLPGVSRHLIGAALGRDYPVVMGVVLLYGIILVTLSTLSRLLHPILDPRVRKPGEQGLKETLEFWL